MKYILHLITAACFLIAMPSTFAQGKKLERANNNFDNYAFIDARKAYLEVAEDGFLSEELLMRLGDSYYFTADYVNAAKWYGSLYDFTDQPKTEYLYRYAQALKSSGQYKASDKIMEKFN